MGLSTGIRSSLCRKRLPLSSGVAFLLARGYAPRGGAKAPRQLKSD
jgi:hypothetical protein